MNNQAAINALEVELKAAAMHAAVLAEQNIDAIQRGLQTISQMAIAADAVWAAIAQRDKLEAQLTALQEEG